MDADTSEIISLTSQATSGDPPHESPPRTKAAPKEKIPRLFTVAYYLLLSGLAISLTIASKGTKLWKTSSKLSSERGDLEKDELKSLLLHYLAVLITFYLVQNSDPGYISIDVMKRVSERDGLSILGQEEQEDQKDQINVNCNDEEEGNASPLNICQPATTTTVSAAAAAAAIEMTTIQNKHEITRRGNNAKEECEALVDDGSLKKNGTICNTLKQKRRKICQTCNFAPPLRSHHCANCQRCVATFDHHCNFIGTCIGERNHCRFYWFILFQALGFLKCVSIINESRFGLTSFAHPHLFKNVEARDIWIVIVAKAYLYSLTLPACLIIGIHSWLFLTNGTSFELAKGRHLEYLREVSMCDLPFSSGLYSNVKIFCCLRDDLSSNCLNYPAVRKKRCDWTPILWKPVGTIVHDSEEWYNNLWSNKYWSCC